MSALLPTSILKQPITPDLIAFHHIFVQHLFSSSYDRKRIHYWGSSLHGSIFLGPRSLKLYSIASILRRDGGPTVEGPSKSHHPLACRIHDEDIKVAWKESICIPAADSDGFALISTPNTQC